jgi:anti-anti-sigma factor
VTRERPTSHSDTPLTVVHAPAPRQAFAHWLARVRLTAGQPSLGELRARMKKFDVDIPKSTLGDGLTGRRMLPMERAVAVVRACGGDTGLQAECRTRWILARDGQLPRTPADDGTVPPDLAVAPSTTVPLGDLNEREGVGCEIVSHDDWQIIRLIGEWDFYTVNSLRPHLDVIIDDNRHPHIAIDLSQTTFMDSCVLGTLVYVLKALRFRGAVLRLVSGVNEAGVARMAKVLMISGLMPVLPVFPTLNEALSPLSTLERSAPPVRAVADIEDTRSPAARPDHRVPGPRASASWRDNPPA